MKAGSIVRLKSGGPMMTLIEHVVIQEGVTQMANCTCAYFDTLGHKVTTFFNESALVEYCNSVGEKQDIEVLIPCQYPNGYMPQATKCQYAKWHFDAHEWKCRYNQPCPFQGYDPNPNYLIKVKQEKR